MSGTLSLGSCGPNTRSARDRGSCCREKYLLTLIPFDIQRAGSDGCVLPRHGKVVNVVPIACTGVVRRIRQETFAVLPEQPDHSISPGTRNAPPSDRSRSNMPRQIWSLRWCYCGGRWSRGDASRQPSHRRLRNRMLSLYQCPETGCEDDYDGQHDDDHNNEQPAPRSARSKLPVSQFQRRRSPRTASLGPTALRALNLASFPGGVVFLEYGGLAVSSNVSSSGDDGKWKVESG